MSRVIAAYTIVALVSQRRSSSLLKRRFCPSQAQGRSTTHLRGRTVKAGRGVGSTGAATRTRRGGGCTTGVVHPTWGSLHACPWSWPSSAASHQTGVRRGKAALRLVRRPSGDAIALQDVCWVSCDGAPQAWGSHQQRALPARDRLGAGIASGLTHPRRLDTLAIQAASPGLGLPPQGHAVWLASAGVHSGRHRYFPPSPPVVLHGCPGGQVVGPAPPRAARPPPGEDRLAKVAPRVRAWAPACSGPWQPRLAPWPCVVGESGRLREALQPLN
jgi:hypothetical protein